MNDPQFQARRRNLRIILVLSIIGSGFSCLSYLVTGISMPMFKTRLDSWRMVLPAEMDVMVEQWMQTPRSFFLVSALLYALSLTGVILMWNLRKSGFHLYTLAQLLILLITVLFLGKEMLGLGNVMFTLLFVVYYYAALRNLGVFQSDRTTSESDDAPPENGE